MLGLLKWTLGIGVAIGVLLAVVFQTFVADQIGEPRILLNAVLGTGIETPGHAELNRRLQLAPGFRLELFAGNLPNARGLAATETDDLILTRPRKGEVILLKRDTDGNGSSDGSVRLAAGLNMPQGVAVVGEWLYIAETDAVGRIRFDAKEQKTIGFYERLVTGLPGGGNHWARNLRTGPDGWLYFNIGSSCNVCEEEDQRRGTLMRMLPDGSKVEVFATGLRNSTAFGWAPWDGRLYAADISRDFLGDDFPPDELNVIEKGAFYGWPYANGRGISDPDYGHLAAAKVEGSRSPEYAFRAHTTPLGIAFPQHSAIAKRWPRSALVTLHGSWNRSEPDGYSLVLLHWTGAGDIVEIPVVTGFWNGESISGRPADVVETSDGAIYVSDDYAGAVYRLVYAQP